MKLIWRWLAVLGLIAGLTPFVPTNIAFADNAVVGSGSTLSCDESAFDAALLLAHQNGGGEITFNCGGPATINLTGLKTILTTNDITINGANEITLDGTALADGMFSVQGGTTFSLVGLTVQNSTRNASGGLIFNAGGTLSIIESTVSDNTAAGGVGTGGAIFNAGGNVSIESSTFSGNTSQEPGGAIFHSGGSLTILESTFYDNSSTVASGGALAQNAGTTVIEGATLNGNSAAGAGGAIGLFGGSATVARSIVAGNTAPGGANCFSVASLTSLDYNLSDDATCPFILANDIQNSANVDLGPLEDNGGPTMTLRPGEDSDALDAAGDCAALTDQRGEERPSGAACDIGSVEVQIIPSATFTLCANWYTGKLYSPFNGVCNPSSQIELVTPDAYPLAFCLAPWTGAVTYSFGRPCPGGTVTHVVPDNGDLLTCVNSFTTLHRFVRSHSQCTAFERLNTIYSS